MIYQVHEQVLKLCMASSAVHWLYEKEEMLQRIPKKAYLFYVFEFES
jgi:hypothetical protein